MKLEHFKIRNGGFEQFIEAKANNSVEYTSTKNVYVLITCHVPLSIKSCEHSDFRGFVWDSSLEKVQVIPFNLSAVIPNSWICPFYGALPSMKTDIGLCLLCRGHNP